MPYNPLIIIPWTKTEDRRMAKLAKAGVSASNIAAMLGRSPGATRQRALIVGVRFKSLGVKHSRAQKRRYVK